MFKFFKDKLKNTISRFSDNVKTEAEDAEKPEDEAEEKQLKEEDEALPEKDQAPEEKKQEEEPARPAEPEEKQLKEEDEALPEKSPAPEEEKQEEEPARPAEPEEEKEKPEKAGFISKIRSAVSTKKLSEKKFEELFWDLELVLLENNVAVEVIDKVKNDLMETLTQKPIQRSRITQEVTKSLKSSLDEILSTRDFDFIEKVKEKKPFSVCFVGINGSGKTTTIAKVANLLKKNGFTCCLAAADTFRAAAIDQLGIHADKLGVKLIKHDYGADPAAVAYDAVKHAEARNLDVVLIDTAGRIHSNVNLQDEMKKIVRVVNPDLKIFVGESITGNDCIEQAKQFNEAIGLDGIILSKADIDEKGGAAISISYVTKKPILYIGTGQEYDDLEKFDKDKLMSSLGLSEP